MGLPGVVYGRQDKCVVAEPGARMGNSWVREFRDGTAQSPDSVTPLSGNLPNLPFLLLLP